MINLINLILAVLWYGGVVFLAIALFAVVYVVIQLFIGRSLYEKVGPTGLVLDAPLHEQMLYAIYFRNLQMMMNTFINMRDKVGAKPPKYPLLQERGHSAKERLFLWVFRGAYWFSHKVNENRVGSFSPWYLERINEGLPLEAALPLIELWWKVAIWGLSRYKILNLYGLIGAYLVAGYDLSISDKTKDLLEVRMESTATNKIRYAWEHEQSLEELRNLLTEYGPENFLLALSFDQQLKEGIPASFKEEIFQAQRTKAFAA